MKTQRFKKADEMERFIQLQAMKWAYAFVILALLAAMVYDNIIMRQPLSRPFMILISQNIVLLVAQLYYKHRMTADDELKDTPILKLSVIILIIALVIGFISLVVFRP
ncbi:MAG: hypothetical protein ACOYEN_10455, partial [Limnochordia bacterium]|jgi:hypothetical protein